MTSSTKDTFVKHNLGKLWLLCSIVFLYAEDFSYAIHSEKQDAYLKEGIYLSVDFNQTNPDMILLFQFAIDKNKDYKVYSLHAKNNDTLHHTMRHNSYIIYPLRTGDINITFSLTKRITDDAKVAHFASGDRDDFKKLETKDIPIALPPLTLHVKPLPKGTQLIGDFTLKSTIQAHEAEAYAPIAMHVTITGEGYAPTLSKLLPDIPHVKYFRQNPILKRIPLKQALHYTVEYTEALASKQNFTLPSTSYQVFNPKTEKSYLLTISEQNFTIHTPDKESLVDNVDTPAVAKVDWSWLPYALQYLLVFFSGVLSAWAWKWQKKATQTKQQPLIHKIRETKEARQLLQLLLAQDSKRFAKSIESLEKALYQDGKINLSKVKKEAIDLI